MRICSLLPSATEIVCLLGLEKNLVAITHECDFPESVQGLPRITSSAIDHSGSTSAEIDRHITDAVHRGSSIYHLDQQLLEELDPDIILTQELCDVCAVSYQNVKEAVRLLDGEHRIVSLEPTSLEGILDTILEVGRLLDKAETAQREVSCLRGRIEAVALTPRPAPPPRVFAMEWLDPLFSGGHWIPEMIEMAGGIDGLSGAGVPSRKVSWEELADYDPEVVVVMPCGFDLDQTLSQLGAARFPALWHNLSAVRGRRLYAVNGSAYFNRPGPRIVDGLEILAEILNADQSPLRPRPGRWLQFDELPPTTSDLPA